MSKNFQFLGFELTPAEKYKGIATVRVLGEVVIVLRYKIVAKKDGSGYFPTCAAYKMPERGDGDEYEDCFMLDSRTDNEAMRKFIMHHVKDLFAPSAQSQGGYIASQAQAHAAFQHSTTPPQYYNAPSALAPKQQAAPQQYQQPPAQQQFFEQPPF